MVKSLLLTCALGLGQSASTHPQTINQVRDEQVEVMQFMAQALPKDVEVAVSWEDCGMVNAFYFPAPYFEPAIVLCNESLLNSPGHAVFEAAHEMGHALVNLRELPVDADGKADERAADQLAALAMIEMGKLDELIAAGMYYRSLSTVYVPKDDPHPDYATRSWELMCLADGAEENDRGTPQCTAFLSMVRTRWALAFFVTAED